LKCLTDRRKPIVRPPKAKHAKRKKSPSSTPQQLKSPRQKKANCPPIESPLKANCPPILPHIIKIKITFAPEK